MTWSITTKIKSLFSTIIILLCIVSVAFIGFVYILQIRAQQIYGPPAANLSNFEGIYLAVNLVLDKTSLIQPMDPDGLPIPFDVRYGESTNSIINRLAQVGLINNPISFRNFLRYSGLDTGIQAGNYSISPSMTPIFIAQIMQDASPMSVNFTILAGWRLEEIAESLQTSGITFSPDIFLTQAYNPDRDYFVSNNLPDAPTLEGYFLPDTYNFERTVSVNDFILRILQNFHNYLTPELIEGLHNSGIDLYQGVTLASIVEREAILDEEMPLIASVFHNRLKLDIKLDADPTVQYAVGYNVLQGSWWTNPLTFDDLSINSPYNTYMNIGLPPGPIANPGIVALQAVAFPAQTPYYYFRAACDKSGRHVFAENLEEHVNNACK